MKTRGFGTRDIAVVALMSALLVSGKFVFQFLPNIEPVTLFLVVFCCSAGFLRTILACLVFCALDNLLYPASIDVTAAYFLYWPLLVTAVKLLNLKKLRNEYINCALVFFMTALFGVITSFFQAIIIGQDFIRIYIVGIPFYAMHIASNTVIVLLLFKPLVKLLSELYNKPLMRR